MADNKKFIETIHHVHRKVVNRRKVTRVDRSDPSALQPESAYNDETKLNFAWATSLNLKNVERSTICENLVAFRKYQTIIFIHRFRLQGNCHRPVR